MGQTVIIKAPPHSLQNYYCCEQQSDFQRHTYLLFCEEDVSVAQLKIKIMKNCGYHLNSHIHPHLPTHPTLAPPFKPAKSKLCCPNTHECGVWGQSLLSARPTLS